MSRKFTQSMALLLSFCAIQNSWSGNYFSGPVDEELMRIKSDLKECREGYAALEQKVNEVEDNTKKDYAELEQKFTESNEQIMKMYTTMMNAYDQVCNPKQVKLDERVTLPSSESDFTAKIIDIIDKREAKIKEQEAKINQEAKIKEAKKAGIEVVLLNGKVVCSDSNLEYDVYKTLNEKQKEIVKTVVKNGYKIEYVNSEILINGKEASFVTDEEYNKLITEYPRLKGAQIFKQNGSYRVFDNDGIPGTILHYLRQ